MGPTAKASRLRPARPAGCNETRAIEPTGIGGAGLAEPAFQHVLAVEMRAFAIGGRGRMHDRRGARLVHAVQVRHRRIERKERIERQRRGLAVEREAPVAAQRHPVRIADRGDRGQAIERAAQHDHQQARIAALGARDLRQIGPGEQRAGGEQQLAA
jgi:hypothetical protein